MPFATRAFGLLTALFVMSPILDARAAPPEETRPSRGGTVPPSVGGFIPHVSCHMSQFSKELGYGVNPMGRNDSNAPLPIGTKIAWKPIGPLNWQDTGGGVHTLTKPLPPGGEERLDNGQFAYAKSCTATIVQ